MILPGFPPLFLSSNMLKQSKNLSRACPNPDSATSFHLSDAGFQQMANSTG